MEPLHTYPLSHPQRRIWYTEAVYPNTTFANLSGTVLYHEPDIDLTLLNKAINHVVERHDALRIRIEKNSRTQAVTQTVSRYQSQKLKTISWDDAAVLQQKNTTFQLFGGALYEFALISAPDQCGYYFCFHHIICDAMSVTLLNNEIHAIYQELKHGDGIIVHNASVPYTTFIDREQAYLISENCQADKVFWLKEFENMPEPVNFSWLNRAKTLTTARTYHSLGLDLSAAIREFCSRHHTTLFRFFMSILYIYLTRITNAKDIVVGTGHHNRLNNEEKQMVGMTVSTLPIRLCFDEGMDFPTLLSAVSVKISHCLQHQQFPYDLLALKLRQKGYDPQDLLAVTFNHIPSLTDAYRVERFSPGFDPALLNIKLNPNQLPADAPLELAIDYRTEVFDSQSATALLRHVETLIREILKAPHKAVHSLEILTETDKISLIQLGTSKKEDTGDKCIHRLMEDQARRTPHLPALFMAKRAYSYEELDKRSNQLARRLRKLGVARDSCVAIMVERTPEVVMAAIAIWKAGGAYLPIDPGQPWDRLAFMLTEARVSVVIGQQHLSAKASSFSGSWISFNDEEALSEDDSSLNTINHLTDLAYILYTSGSTGQPKGVLVEHGSLVNFCWWYKDFYDLQEGFRQGAYADFTFDVSMADLFPPLLVGGSVHILPDEIRLSPYKLNEYLQDEAITLLFLPTRVGEVFMQTIDHSSLRILTLAGEKLTQWIPRHYRIVNAYGPTETTVYATVFSVDRAYVNIPIGRPVPNTCAYVVDANGKLLPSGVPGELWLSSRQVARGYLNRPELTRERFIPNPYADNDECQRVYRTGDRVRWLADGQLEYLGRLDDQLKIRGIRIEPGEIEQCMLKHPLIREAVVMGSVDGDKLCGVFVEENELSIDDVRKYLLQSLPVSYVPAILIKVPSLPMTPTGKIDKCALHAFIDHHMPKKTHEEQPPVSPTEKRLHQLWLENLRLSHIGIVDDYFQSGGHSLTAMALFVSLKTAFSIDLPVSILYQASTIEKLARIIDDQGPRVKRLICMQTGYRRSPIFCLHDFTGEILSYGSIASSLGDEWTIYGLRYDFSMAECPGSIEEMAAGYLQDIRTVQPNGPYCFIGYSSGGTLAYEIAQQLQDEGEEIALLALLDTPNYRRYPIILRDCFHLISRIALTGLSLLPRLDKSMHFKAFSNMSCVRQLGPLLSKYRPKCYPGDLFLIRSRYRTIPMDQSLGWGDLVSGTLHVHRVGHNHFTLTNSHNADMIVKLLVKYLEKV